MATVKRWKLLWETWDLRGVILFSLVIQIFLISFAPLRKRVSTVWISIPIWFAYLLVDVIANFAAGLISKSQGDTSGPFANRDLLAFWASFLLVHLGGPDTITAFALEDNEFWLRHSLGLGFQCWVVVSALVQSFSSNKLWIPTVLMFVTGVIKYVQRIRALYLASSRRFKDSLLTIPDPGPNYSKLMDQYISFKAAGIPARIEMVPELRRIIRKRNKAASVKLSDLEVVQIAHDYFVTSKGLMSDMNFSSTERNESQGFFFERTPRDAFKVAEVELNFFYDVLYTKATVVQGMLGYLFRILSFSLNCTAIVLFYFIDKKEFEKFDIGVSYALLLGAIALDLIASVMVLCSNWTVVALSKSDHPNWFIKILRTLLNLDRVRWPTTPINPKCFSLGIINIFQRGWSESLCKYNLINYCVHPRANWWETTIDFFGLTNMLDGVKYVETVKFTNYLRNLIFEELKMKSELTNNLETAKAIFSSRGDWILHFENCSELLHWISEFDFDEIVILWHTATELCFSTDEKELRFSTEDEVTNADNGGRNPTNLGEDNEDVKDFRAASKLLSDYLLYLLIMESTMLSTVAGIGRIRFRDTCAEAKKFFRERRIRKSEEGRNCCLNIFAKCFYWNKFENREQQSESSCCCRGKEGPDKLRIRACKSILAVETEVPPEAVKGGTSKSVLFYASTLAKELKKLGNERMWQIISKVWVELLSYAACRCRANSHAAQLSNGGQLLTLVWLLMAHLGLGDPFQVHRGQARAKLITSK